MKKSANVNEKKIKLRKPQTKEEFFNESKKENTPLTSVKEPDTTTVRHLSDGDKSILEDLGIMEKLKLEHDKNVQYNKKYGFDVPFINEMMQNFNQYLNNEGKKFMNDAEEASNN